MTVIMETIKPSVFFERGEIKIFKDVTKIIEKEGVFELIRNGKYVGVLNKEFCKITAVG